MGDMVWRWYPPKAQQKLGSGWTGPYCVTRKFSDITYEIQHHATGKTLVVHVDHLKPVQGNGESENQYDSDHEEIVDFRDDDSLVNSDDDDANDLTVIDPQTQSSSPCPHVKLSRRGRLIKPAPRYSP